MVCALFTDTSEQFCAAIGACLVVGLIGDIEYCSCGCTERTGDGFG